MNDSHKPGVLKTVQGECIHCHALDMTSSGEETGSINRHNCCSRVRLNTGTRDHNGLELVPEVFLRSFKLSDIGHRLDGVSPVYASARPESLANQFQAHERL